MWFYSATFILNVCSHAPVFQCDLFILCSCITVCETVLIDLISFPWETLLTSLTVISTNFPFFISRYWNRVSINHLINQSLLNKKPSNQQSFPEKARFPATRRQIIASCNLISAKRCNRELWLYPTIPHPLHRACSNGDEGGFITHNQPLFWQAVMGPQTEEEGFERVCLYLQEKHNRDDI